MDSHQSLGLLEFSTVASGIEAADCAVKTAQIQLGRLHLASGFGGKAYFTVAGSQSDVEVAIAAAQANAGEKALDFEVIASPHGDLDPNQFVRPWGIDPAG